MIYTVHDSLTDRVSFLHDASRPFVVLATGRKTKHIAGRYKTKSNALRRARQLSHRNPLKKD